VSRDKTDPTLAVERPAEPAGRIPDLPELSGRDYQELWFSLARHPWRSAVLVPADPAIRSDEAAHALAGIGRKLGFTQVSALVADQIEFATVGQLTSRVAAAQAPAADGAAPPQIIVAIPPVVLQPLGVAVARAADTVVICLAVGQTSLEHVRHTIELVGRERIRGAMVVPARR
jgi:hypothetical protein